MGTDADVHARTHTYGHGRRRMGTDADVHARTRTDADVLWDLSERIMGLWDLSEWTRTHVNERTQAIGGRIYGREKNTRYAAGGREKNTQNAAG